MSCPYGTYVYENNHSECNCNNNAIFVYKNNLAECIESCPNGSYLTETYACETNQNYDCETLK